MAAEQPNVMEQQPMGGNVNKPASGTYGEKAELDRLKQELPMGSSDGGGQAAPQMQPPSPMGPTGNAPPTPPQGLPKGLTLPTQQPDVPMSTPPMQPVDPFAGAPDAPAKRLRYLEILSSSPQASADVREWASTLLRALNG